MPCWGRMGWKKHLDEHPGGLYRADEGKIVVNGQQVTFTSPRQAIEHGIGMIHQHFMLVPSQTVTENILLGLGEPRFFLNISHYERIIANLGEKFGLHVDPKAKVWQLSVGEQQRVEILKMLYRGAEILIMDEPTAVLAPTEIGDAVQYAAGDGGRGQVDYFYQPQAE